jgi:heme exporter protein B
MLGLLKRDLALAVRAGGGFGLSLAFFLIFATLVPFGVGPQTQILETIAPGILWLGALLACLLSLDRIFQLDWEDGTLDLLATAPVPLEGVAAIKALSHWITTGLPLVLLAPILGLLLNLPLPAYPWLLASLALGTPALSAIGTFGAALTVGIRRGGLLLSLLVLPLYVPRSSSARLPSSAAPPGKTPRRRSCCSPASRSVRSPRSPSPPQQRSASTCAEPGSPSSFKKYGNSTPAPCPHAGVTTKPRQSARTGPIESANIPP